MSWNRRHEDKRKTVIELCLIVCNVQKQNNCLCIMYDIGGQNKIKYKKNIIYS